MKKLLTLLNRAKATTMLLAALFTMNVVSAATGTETNPTTNGTKDVDIVGTCYTILATYNPAGVGAVGSLGTGLKLRTNKEGNKLVFNVNEGYTITKFVLDGVANDEGSISTVKVEVDGAETTFEGGGTFTKDDVVNITIQDIKATTSIAIYFDNENVTKNSQIFAVYSIDWETSDGEETDSWFGLTQAVDKSAKTLGAATFTGIEHVTNSGNLMGSKVDSYMETGANDKGNPRYVYIDDTQYQTDAQWRKNENTSAYTENQWMGYDLTVESGYMLTITGVHAMMAVADDTYTWKVVILDASGNELYKSEDNTTKKASTKDFILKMDEEIQAKLTNLSGKISVRLYMYQGGSTKYFAVPYLTVTGSVEEDTRATYTVTTSVSPANSGTLTPENGSDFVEGSNVTFTATPATGYKFVKLTVDEQTVSNPYVLENISKDVTAVAEFEALPKVTYVLGDGVVGTTPDVEYVEAGKQITLPAAMLISNPGKTLTGWNDGNTTYNVGEQATINGDVTFTAVFEDNQASLGDAETTVNWVLRMDEGAPYMKVEGAIGYYTQKAVINGKTIDVAMKIDATNEAYKKAFNITDEEDTTKGKCETQDNRAQVNKGTWFTIPAVRGMVVTITATSTSNMAVSSFKFDGEDADEKTSTGLVYTYNGDAETIDLIDQGNSLYPSSISVVYPAVEKTKSVTTTISEAKYATFYAEFDATIPAGVTAYGATLNEENTAIVLTAIEGNVIPAETAVILYSETADDYTFTEAEEAATEVVSSVLKGTAVETSISENDYVLGNGSKGVGFYHLESGVNLGANQAYLPASALTANGARVAFIGFGDNTVTAIDAVAAPASAGKAYNLNGVQATAGAKGVVIMDGKKVVIK